MDLVDSKSELSQGITKRSNNIRREGKKINQCHIRSWKPGLDVIPESTGWGFRIMPRPDQINDDGDETARQNLLERLLGCVQRCQIRFGGRKSELATEQVRAVGEVCSALEAVLEHGLLRPSSSLLSKLGGSASANDGSCWPLIKQHLSKSELDRFYLLKNVNCDRGRCRAWLRAALNEHSLERHLAAIIAEPAKISGLYHGWSFLLDEERASILPSMSAGLSSILFAINIDSPALNEPKNQTERDDEESEGNLLAADKSSSFSSSSSSHKKKRKVLPQLVNFDEHSLKEDENDDESQNPSNLVPAGRQGRSREKKGGETNHASSSSGPNHNPHHQVSQENPDPEDDEEIYSGRSRTSSLSTEDESKNGGKSKTINRPPLSLAKLTPMKNSGVGALIPVGSGDDVLDGQSEDSLSIRSYGDESDYASACSKVGVAGAAKKPAHSLMARKDSPSANAGAARSLNNNALLSADAAKDTRRGEGGGSSQGSSSTLSREDLKQALLSVMERKEELQVHRGQDFANFSVFFHIIFSSPFLFHRTNVGF